MPSDSGSGYCGKTTSSAREVSSWREKVKKLNFELNRLKKENANLKKELENSDVSKLKKSMIKKLQEL